MKKDAANIFQETCFLQQKHQLATFSGFTTYKSKLIRNHAVIVHPKTIVMGGQVNDHRITAVQLANDQIKDGFSNVVFGYSPRAKQFMSKIVMTVMLESPGHDTKSINSTGGQHLAISPSDDQKYLISTHNNF